MKNLTLFTLLTLLITFHFLPAQAPDTLWTRTYGSGVGNCVIETSDHGYVIVGCTEFLGTGDLRLIKVNSVGNTLWSKIYGDTSDDTGYSVRQTADSGFIIIGTTSSYGAGQEDVWLIKTDEYGDTVWTRTFGGVGSDIGKCIQITNDGGFIIVGSTSSYGAGGQDVWLIKTDSNGITQWTKTFGDTTHGGGNCVKQTTDSGYIIAGTFGTSVPFSSDGNVWLIKTNSNGDTVWTTDLDHGSAWCVCETSDGFIVSTTSTRNGMYNLGNGVLFKTDFMGDTLWNKILIQGGEHTNGKCVSVNTTWNNGYIIAGNLSSFPGGIWGTIIETDSTGNILWELSSLTEFVINPLYSAIQTSNSCYLATGAYHDSLSLVKLGSLLSSLKSSQDITIKDFSLSQNYPNPFNPSTTIEFTLPQSSFVTLKIYNILGEEVATLVSDRLSAGSDSYEWDASNLASGVYLYRLEAGDFVEIKKMVLLR